MIDAAAAKMINAFTGKSRPVREFVDMVNMTTLDESARSRVLLAEVLYRLEVLQRENVELVNRLRNVEKMIANPKQAKVVLSSAEAQAGVL